MPTDLDRYSPPGPARRSTQIVPYGQQPRRGVVRTPVRFARRAGWWATKTTVRHSYRHRVRLAPVFLGMLVWIMAAGLHFVHNGWRAAFIPAGLAALVLFVYGRVRRRDGRPLPSRHHLYLWGCCGAGTGWLIPAAAAGPTAGPLSGLLLVIVLAGAGPYWWHRRIRPTAVDEVLDPEDGGPVEPEIVKWVTRVATTDGVLPDTELDRFTRLVSQEGRIGWEADMVFGSDRVGVETAQQGIVRLSRVFDVPTPSVVISPTLDGRPSRGHITVLNRNPLVKANVWMGPSLTEDGVCRLGVHPDGRVALYRFWRLESGAVHTLLSGGTDAGKSRVVDLLLCEERLSPLIASWVIDPQQGQSLPAWRGNVDIFAETAADGADLLEHAAKEMYRRNKILARMEWVDDRGRNRVGVDCFNPTVEMPLISITVEEAQAVLGDPRAIAAAKDLAGMGRKCGMKLRLVTQLPLLEQLGNSMYLRDQVALGNVIVLRTAGPLAGQVAFNGSLPGAEPHLLPRPDGTTTAGLGYALGASSHQAMMRADWVDKHAVYDWIEAGTTTGSGTLFVPRSAVQDAVPAALAAVPDAATAASGSPVVDQGLPARDKVLAYALAAPGAVRTGIVAAAIGESLPTTSKWMKKLTSEGLLLDLPGSGEYLAVRRTA
jgi:hypothetical protein